MFKKTHRPPKDTDFLFISARLHVLETRLLTRERMEQMLEAREDAEAVKIMVDCGYPEPKAPLTLTGLEESLAQAQADLMADLAPSLENAHVLPVFQIRYDYHNAKALIKAQAKDADPHRLLVAGGRFDPQKLAEDFAADDLAAYPETFRTAVAEAKSLLATSQDPQQADFLLDRACCAELTQEAQLCGSPFLMGYIRLHIDALNLRAAVRSSRAGKGPELLRQALIPGGDIPPDQVLAARGDALQELYKKTPLEEAAQLGTSCMGTGNRKSLTAFERACDNAVMGYVSAARRIPFGVETAIGYLCARQSELTALRTIFSGRLAGVDKEVIRERLREAYA